MLIVNLNVQKNHWFLCQNYQRICAKYWNSPCFSTRHGFQEKGQGWKQKSLEMYQSLNWQNIHLQSHQQGQSTADGEISDALLLMWRAAADVRALQVVLLGMEKSALTILAARIHHAGQAQVFALYPTVELEYRNGHAEHTHPLCKGPQSKLQGLFLNCPKISCH